MKSILICGAGGFIGSHLTKYFKDQGHRVIGIDLKHPEFSPSHCDKYIIADLRDKKYLEDIVNMDIDEVYQLAADMGGAGYIFSGDHDAKISSDNALININILDMLKKHNVKKVFYASSACVYSNATCEESSAYPAEPDSEYGWEKLFSERLYLSYRKNHGIDCRIARFHNIFGPEGTWQGGREKAPAALCRKIIKSSDNEIEVYGSGDQTRSFLYIDECVKGIDKIMNSGYHLPLNLGSERAISINDLTHLIAKLAYKEVKIKNIDNGLQGAASRVSHNALLEKHTGWKPSDTLEEGLKKTYAWIVSQI